MLGFGAIGQFAIGEVGAGGTAEVITLDKWFQPLSQPPRFLPGLRPSQQQFSALPNPIPFVSFGWYQGLSKPALQTRQRPAEFPPFFMQPAPSPFVPTGWFVPLSEPPRFRPGLKAAQQQFSASDTTPVPQGRIIPWYVQLSEPPRTKPGLRAALQQFYAGPAQLRPTPTSFAALSALETKDTFIASALTWARAVSGEVGVIELSFTGAEIGVVAPRIVRARIAITII